MKTDTDWLLRRFVFSPVGEIKAELKKNTAKLRTEPAVTEYSL